MVRDTVTVGILVILLVIDGILWLVYRWAGRRFEVDGGVGRTFDRIYLLGAGLVNVGALLLVVGFRTFFLPIANPESPFAALAPLPLQDAGAVTLLVGYAVVVAALGWLGLAATRAG